MVGGSVFRGGRIFTGHRWVDAISLDGGRVIVAGTDAEVRRGAPHASERIDLHGHIVIPGLIDAHLHLGGMALQKLGVALDGARNEGELAKRALAWAVDRPSGPVLGRGWDQERMEGQSYPTRASLDAAFPDREVVLYRVCGHVALVNGRTLETLGIGPATPEPDGGRIARDHNGTPTGVLFDAAMSGLGAIGERALSHHPKAFEAILDEAAACGLTTVASMGASPSDVELATRRADVRAPPVRLRFYVDLRHLKEIADSPREGAGGLVRVSGVKAITDGSFGARTAWLSEPYDDLPSETGFPVGSSDELADGIAEAGRLGLQVALHAIGDRAVYRVLRLLQVANAGPTPRIEHASLVPPNLYPMLDRVRPHLVVQPRFVVSDSWLPERLGTVRARFAYPFRSLLDRGYRLAGSSDAPVESFDPWTGIAAAVHRGDRRPGGRDRGGSEQISVEAAVRLYTIGAGAALEEPGLGTLEAGAPADLVRLSTTTLEAALAAGRGAVAETWRDGVQVSPAPGIP